MNDSMFSQFLVSPLLAATDPSILDHLLSNVIYAIIFSLVGVLAFAACLWLVNRLCPFSLRKEIEEDQNTGTGGQALGD